MIASKKNLIRQNWKQNYPRDLSWQREASQKITSLVLASDAFKGARYIALYSALPWEVDVTALWQARPTSCVFPKVLKEEQRLEFYAIKSLLDLKPGYSKISEPQGEGLTLVQDWNKSDLFLIPGFAFDTNGTRIGSGKGFYDKFFSSHKISPLKWGICFSSQVSKEALPVEPHDIRMNALCTEKGITVI